MTLDSDIAAQVEGLVSRARFASYLRETGGDRQTAADLYQWNVAVSGACLEAFHLVEIVVRNAIDRALAEYFDEDARRIPWFLLPIVAKPTSQRIIDDQIEGARRRLRNQGPGREAREQIVAGLSFGFWTSLLHTEYEELWRQATRKAFPHSSGRRHDVVGPLENLRQFRNKLAHHDSLLRTDVPQRLQQMRQVLSWIDPSAEQWLVGTERVTQVFSTRPVSRPDTVVVPAQWAWPLYQAVGAYLCQPGRSFQPVDRVAFYADQEIKPDVPRIVNRLDHVEWGATEVGRLSTGGADERRLAEIMEAGLDHGWTAGRMQVFDLTSAGHPDHRRLDRAVPHTARGRGSAFVQRQRYVSMAVLSRARTTVDL